MDNSKKRSRILERAFKEGYDVELNRLNARESDLLRQLQSKVNQLKLEISRSRQLGISDVSKYYSEIQRVNKAINAYKAGQYVARELRKELEAPVERKSNVKAKVEAKAKVEDSKPTDIKGSNTYTERDSKPTDIKGSNTYTERDSKPTDIKGGNTYTERDSKPTDKKRGNTYTERNSKSTYYDPRNLSKRVSYRRNKLPIERQTPIHTNQYRMSTTTKAYIYMALLLATIILVNLIEKGLPKLPKQIEQPHSYKQYNQHNDSSKKTGETFRKSIILKGNNGEKIIINEDNSNTIQIFPEQIFPERDGEERG